MSNLGSSLPVPPPHAPSPDPKKILEQPSEDSLSNIPASIRDETFSDIDPGVFNEELLKLGIYTKYNHANPSKAEYAGGNIVTGTYTGTQAALTHLYDRIERTYESYFDVLQIEPTLPKYFDLSDKKKMYRYSAYPTEDDGSPARYPPHLQTIPRKDKVSQLEIFNALGLAQTQIMVTKVIPDSLLGKTADWLLTKAREHVAGTPQVAVTIQDAVDYNMYHRKSGTDIARGDNLGHLPDWYSDRRFAEQSFTGTNPTTITRAPADLVAEFIEAAKKLGYSAWAEALPKIDPTSLLVQDCRYFRSYIGAAPDAELYNKEDGSDDDWACAAVTLFQLHDDGKLHPIAIVCDYKVSMSKSVTIFNSRMSPQDSTKGEATDWPWRYAKTCAQVSDWLLHELIVHLTNAHFIEESIIVATNRTVPMEHIVFKLLYPHWYKTLSLNAAARDQMVPQAIKDIIGFTPEQAFKFIRSGYENFDFVQSYVPNDLKRRGFPCTEEELKQPKYKNYAYAKNILPMWKVIRKYVVSMLLTAYNKETADTDVAKDKYVQDWVREVREGGRIKNFPDIKRLDDLADAITMCIHIAAPFHSTVNYLQNFYQGFVPAKPPALCAPLPTSLEQLKKYKEQDLVQALPIGRQRQWLLASQIPWLLSFKVASDRSLVSFALSQWVTKRKEEKGVGRQIRDITERFYLDLRGLQKDFLFVSRDMDEGSIPYMVMDPTNTAVSILI